MTSIEPTSPLPDTSAHVNPAAFAERRLTVLLVEDDAADVFVVRELFDEVHAPIDLRVATSVAEARQQLDGVQCILLDLDLPDAKGLDGLRRLLRSVERAAICVLTGRQDEHLGIAAVAEGAQDYLIKGRIDGTLLARAVRYAVERKRADENIRRLREAELRQRESARLERGLLPQPLMDTPAAAVHTFYRPGRHSSVLGGDFYDVVQTGPGRLELLVGDVCGHGVEEAALGAELRVAWRALVLAGVPEEETLAALEQVLVSERRVPEIFATVATVTVDLDDGLLTARLAGHPPPLFLSGGSVATLPVTHGPVLGVFPDARWPAAKTRISPADWSLLLYTDGLIEGHSGNGARRLEVAGLRALLDGDEVRHRPLADLPAWLVSRAETLNGGPLADDVAMLLLAPSGGK